MRQTLTFLIALLITFSTGSTAAQPSTNYTTDTRQLLDFVNTRYQAYFHYNMCTFKNLHSPDQYEGRSRGAEPVDWWNPTGLDTDQWAQVVIDARMAGGWLTTKHHGGFCLWESAYTDYDVASAPVKTDVVRAFVDSFRKRGLKIGLYYSILDYHHGVENGSTTREEIQFIKNQLTELLTNYGPIDYMNFDGWSTWPTNPDFDDIHYFELYRHVKKLQPDCLIVSHTYESNIAHSEVPFADAAGRAYPYHPDYMRPTAASDFLERGWWWHPKQYRVSKSVDYILKQLDSYNSHNSVYVLNISPNPDGRIEAAAIQRLKEAAAKWDKPADLTAPAANWGFQYDVNKNLAFGKRATQSSTHTYIRDKRAYPRAEIALDGVLEGDLKMEQTSFTNADENAWWQVDLEKPCTIRQITIYNRTDAEMDRLKDYDVMVLDANGKVVWKSRQTDVPNPSATIKTGGITGQFVKIQLTGTAPLHIAEVIVE